MSIWYLVGAVVFVSFGLIVLRGAPYVPTHKQQGMRAFTKLRPLSSDDVVVDLGAGDGAILATAYQNGADAVGYELNPILWAVMSLRFWGRRRIKVYLRDYLLIAKPPAGTTVVYVFTTSLSIGAIEQLLERWSRASSFDFISYGFELPSHELQRKDGPMNLYHFVKKP